MNRLLRIELINGSSIQIDPAVWPEVASSATSGSMCGTEYVSQRLIVVKHADGRRLAYLDVGFGDKRRATGEFIEGDSWQTLNRVIERGLACPTVIDLVGGCLLQLRD
jgi:hypothetical protein